MKTFRIELLDKKERPLLQVDVKAKDYQTLRKQVKDFVRFDHRRTYHLLVSELTEQIFDKNGDLSEETCTPILDLLF